MLQDKIGNFEFAFSVIIILVILSSLNLVWVSFFGWEEEDLRDLEDLEDLQINQS